MNRLTIELPELAFAAQEALNRLRINIKFVGSNTKRIMVTSSQPDEGKSSVALYLWKMLAEAGFLTLYVDLDLRKSVISTRYKMESQGEMFGAEHYISGERRYDEVIYETNYPNAYMIPCSNALKNPSVLFEDAKFKQLMEQAGNDFRYVIIDTPPLMDVSDGAQIASLCDGAVLVVRSGYVPKKAIRNSLQQLSDAKCKLLGVVLNRVQTGSSRYGYGYGYGHGYGYGYGYGQDSAHTKTKEKNSEEG